MINLNDIDLSKFKLKPKCHDSILCEFDSIIDTDMGIYRYLYKNFAGSKYFNYAFNTYGTDEWFLYTALNRKIQNPIAEISTQSEEESLALYLDILKDKEAYKQVLELSQENDLFKLMHNFISMGNFKVTVLCNSEEQEKYIKSKSRALKTLTVDDLKKVNTDNYFAYYVKNYDIVLGFKKFEANQVFVLSYPFNMESDKFVPLRTISYCIFDANEISIIAPYIDPKVPKG